MSRLYRTIVALCLCLPVLSGCSTNPATGRSQFNLLSRSEEIAIGTEAAPVLVEEYGGEVANQRLVAYVERVGRSLVQHTEGDASTLPWEFFLLDSDVVNAFALPGGKVFISRGLASRLSSEAELAGVIGHEIGHVTAKHANERISQQLFVQLGIAAAGLGASRTDEDVIKYGVPIVVGIGGQGYLLHFGRNQELEADKLGLRYMAKSGYDPWALLDVMDALQNASSGNGPPEFLSTHPLPDTRMTKIRNLLNKEHYRAATDPRPDRFERRYETEFLALLAAPGG